ncbi:hypothetical protein IEQ34_020391 [Dendrobium chrysotoxum]|uniref:phospholipase D n=1 Tax=Dendrobium chrysotoxum TaxID=161865 RepID=A0AAV7FKK1_DENCH|nr:hypothetical protein IEQ34_020391 [Dendrobium chrysotoxum]
MDGISVDGLPEKLGTSEHSIHDAYVSAIRRAQRFVYIENQYFMGGCHLWDEDQASGCTNLIPVEIALKVGSKIRAGERFAAYVVIPMWPEGSVGGEAVQSMLHWSRMTMVMMYRVVGEAIRESGVRAHPRDYLNFFCLANREERREGEFVPHSSPPHGSHYWKAQKNRRFMIYVHSKLMIVDDEYILIGSANLNQRSLDGDRDTEIAIGCYQPSSTNGGRRGAIFAYRMTLWYEHAGKIEAAFAEPQSLQCVSTLRGVGDEMWKKYSGEELVDMEGVHLVSYPVDVLEDGSVRDLDGGGGAFPDTSALVRGRRSKIIPPICTT